jgi:hypothetical protein
LKDKRELKSKVMTLLTDLKISGINVNTLDAMILARTRPYLKHVKLKDMT